MSYYFASDIHLGAGNETYARHNEQTFVAWLDSVADDAKGIFLLGDVFDFWFEYKRVVPKGFVRTLAKLAELTQRGIRVVFLTGNHDMWVGDYLARECRVEIYTVPQEMTLNGVHLFLAHGDNMNIRDKPALRLLNSVFRSKTLRWIFSHLLHPDTAMRFGQAWSRRSWQSHLGDPPYSALTEPLVDYARTYAVTHPIDCFVFGHMHFARDFCEGRLHVVCLGNWGSPASYAVMDDAGTLTLKTFEP